MRDPYEKLRGVIDLHVHAGPDLFERPLTYAQIAKMARDVGYRAILFKSHFFPNMFIIEAVRENIPEVLLFGSITLNLSVGGINPEAVYSAIQLGCKEVKMPTVHSKRHIEMFGKRYPWSEKVTLGSREAKPITIIDENNKLIPEVYEILEMIANANIILGTGHLTKPEIFELVKEARRVGVKKVVITHADLDVVSLSVDEQKQLADMGAYIEHSLTPCLPHRQRLDPREIVRAIKAVGAHRCIMSSDLGQYHNPLPIEGMRMFIELMEKLGITEKEIDIMTRQNPAKLLDLE
jgi:predicted metal-dependent TIM-barrel fold hydrolase